MTSLHIQRKKVEEHKRKHTCTLPHKEREGCKHNQNGEMRKSSATKTEEKRPGKKKNFSRTLLCTKWGPHRRRTSGGGGGSAFKESTLFLLSFKGRRRGTCESPLNEAIPQRTASFSLPLPLHLPLSLSTCPSHSPPLTAQTQGEKRKRRHNSDRHTRRKKKRVGLSASTAKKKRRHRVLPPPDASITSSLQPWREQRGWCST